MTVQITTQTQTANKLLGTEDKVLYYLIIENSKKERQVINIGKKTYDAVDKLQKADKDK